MRFVLQIARKLVGWFRKWPHWAKDLYAIVTYVNFIELIPTIGAIALAPRHFFRRLPMVLRHKRPLYRTPVKFFTSSASLFVAVFFLRHPELAHSLKSTEAVWYMLILIPLTPLLMAGLSLVLWSAYQLPRAIPTETPFPQPNPYPLSLVFSLRTYWNLDGRRFFWGLFYFSIYLVVSWQIAQIVIGYGLVATNELLDVFETKRGIVEVIIVIMIVVLLASIVHWLVFRPYGEMVRMSLRHPLPQVFKADAYDVKEEVAAFLVKAERGRPSSEDFDMFLIALAIPLTSIERAVRLQDRDYKSIDVADDYRRKRAEVFAQAFQERKLRGALGDADALPQETLAQVEKVLSTMRQLEALHPYREVDEQGVGDPNTAPQVER